MRGVTPSDRRPPYGWIVVLGVLSGAPYGLVTEALSLVWANAGVDAARITSLTSDAGLPWVWKFLWAPLVDRWASRRAWIAGAAAAIAATLVALSTCAAADTGALVTVLVLATAMASATQDVAIDAYRVEALPERAYGAGNGVHVTAYRAGLLVFGGWLGGRAVGWGVAPAWRVAAGCFAGWAAAAWFLPAAPRTSRSPSMIREPLRRLVARSDFVVVVAFVLFFKACDYAMPGALTKKYLVTAGIPPSVIGDVLTPVGIAATVAGALLGGYVTTRIGLFRALWVLGACQALSNLAYAGAAWSGSPAALYAAAVFEPFCSGLGTAPFLAFLMACCDREFAATHFALWSALMAAGRWGFGRWSGAGAEHFGYATWFALTFLAAIPAFALLPAIRRRLSNPGPLSRG